MNVRPRPTVPAVLAALVAGLVPTLTTAQPGAAVDTTATPVAAELIRPGLTLLDRGGTVLGDVEHVLVGSDGAVRQVLVRTGGVARVRSSLKALPAAGLELKGDTATASLTREELQSLPDATAPETPTALTP